MRIDRRYMENEMPLIYLRFYMVGLVLFVIPYTRNFFVSIITLSLIFVFISAFWFNRDRGKPQIIWAVFIVISAFFLEEYGVASGRLFGEYSYGKGLAPLVKGTPLVIGINWLFLIYSTHLIANRTCGSAVGRIMCGSILMVFYDLAAEWVAPFMEMWSFGSGFPPVRNFAVWFAASVIYHAGFEVFPLKYDNPTARILYAIQIVFFVLIGIYSSIFIL